MIYVLIIFEINFIVIYVYIFIIMWSLNNTREAEKLEIISTQLRTYKHTPRYYPKLKVILT